MASDISIGTLLGDRYEILAEVGRGRVGIVYKANHRRLEKLLAVKVLFEEVGKDETSIKRFELEAKSSARLSHPNIINVLDFGLSFGGFPYLVMEFIDGCDLHSILSSDTRLPLARAIRIITQVCSALDHAHHRGVIHRDLKPSNIMLLNVEGLPDFVKLVDFGIAKRYDSNEDTIERLTMDGQVLGTPAYMSPEQCQAGKLDARSDVYSLGCVLFKMMTGSAPITGNSIIDIIHNHIGQEPLSFAAACPDVRIPPAIQEVVLTALEKEPAKRHQSMREFANCLQAAYATCGVSMPTPATTFPVFPSTPGQNPLVGGGFTGANPLGSPAAFGQAGIPTALVEAAAAAQAMGAAAVDPEVAVYKARKLETLLESANKGDSKAQFELSIRFQNGDGVDSNREEALKWLRAAANSGHREAQYRLGKRLLDGEGLSSATAEGFVWVQKAADQNYEPAQLLIATCYEEGRGTAPSLLKAIHYYRQSEKQGNQHAQTRLAACYQRCFDAGLEAEGFVEWTEGRAADGDVDALYIIACQFSRTGGAARLSKQAAQHLLPSAQQGNIKAQMALAQVYFGGKAPDDAKNGLHWITKAAETGNRDAIVQLAGAIKNGFGTRSDAARAVQLLTGAADGGHLDAQAILGTTLLIGDGVPRNLTRGITLLRNAAGAGSTMAQWKFALCLKNGVGTVRDQREMEKWFDKAAEGKFDQGPTWTWGVPGLRFDEVIQTCQQFAAMEHRQAHYWLGICYEYGIGVQRDLNKALELYMKSANKGFQPALDAANKLKSMQTV